MPTNHRQMCYNCNRPQNCCLCSFVNPIDTKTKFVILIHPKEFKQIKNNTGRLTHMSLKNSELFVGLDFTDHKKINALIDNPKNYCAILYPSLDAINLNSDRLDLEGKRLVLFVIDATWASSKPMLRLSKNLHNLPKMSFTHSKTSTYGFKRQPFEEALSTMESTHCILEILHKVGLESLTAQELKNFLNPFDELVKFQSKFKNAEPRFKDHHNLK
jgi:DTW domain-containing protein YfiP